jgi:hypothetical protein
MAPELSWWRLTVDEAGKVLACVAVERESKNGQHCFYVKARDAKEAARLLSNEISRRLLAARRAKYKAQGLCECGRRRDNPNFVHCGACLERARLHNERQRARQRGEDVEPLDRRVVLQERKQQDRAQAVEAAKPSLRLNVLLEVQEAWEGSGTNQSFTRWLREQIDAARGKKVA